VVDPVLIAAFEGGTTRRRGVVRDRPPDRLLAGLPIAALDPEDYYDFQVNRPTISLTPTTSESSPGRRRSCAPRACPAASVT
jgi:hypothetical protein